MLTFYGSEKTSVLLFYRFWHTEFCGVVRILKSCKGLEENGMNDFNINAHSSEMLHLMPMYAAKFFQSHEEGC